MNCRAHIGKEYETKKRTKWHLFHPKWQELSNSPVMLFLYGAKGKRLSNTVVLSY